MSGDARLVEIDRRAPSFNALKNAVRQKFKVSSDPQLAFQLPSGTKIAVRSDEDLKRAIQESANSRQNYVEIEGSGAGYKPTGGYSGGSSKPAQQQSYAPPPQQQQSRAPQSQPQQQHHQQPARAQSSNPPSGSSAPAPSGGAIISFHLRGSGTADKVKIAPQQEDTRYRFVPTPGADDATIEVELPTARQLSFKISTSKARLTQTFNMPFDVSPKLLTLNGSEVILNFPF